MKTEDSCIELRARIARLTSLTFGNGEIERRTQHKQSDQNFAGSERTCSSPTFREEFRARAVPTTGQLARKLRNEVFVIQWRRGCRACRGTFLAWSHSKSCLPKGGAELRSCDEAAARCLLAERGLLLLQREQHRIGKEPGKSASLERARARLLPPGCRPLHLRTARSLQGAGAGGPSLCDASGGLDLKDFQL